MRNLIIIVGFIFLSYLCHAQYREVARYTTDNGLPTNSIYNCVQDIQGFMWVATDQGALRFDGKQFQRFTTEQGLPDNEVLKMLKENNGRIWVHSFKQTPAYFDDVKNRFISAKEDTLLKNISSKRLLFCHNTLDGGMEFLCETGSYIFENGKKYEYDNRFEKTFGVFIFKIIDKDNYLMILDKRDAKELSIKHVFKNEIVAQKSYSTLDFKTLNIQYIVYENTFYSFVKPQDINLPIQLICLSNIKLSPLQFDKEIINFKKPVNQLSITEHYIIASYISNEFEIYDRQTKKLLQIIPTDYIVNSVFEDSYGTFWVCTTNKGLIKFEKSCIKKMVLPAQLNNILFMNVASNNKGTMYFGTSDNRIIEMQNDKTIIHSLPINSSISGWQRDILFSQNKVFSFSETATYLNFAKPVLIPSFNGAIGSKCATILNDSILIFGSVQSLFQLNSKTEKTVPLPNKYTRVTSLVAYDATSVYYGSLDGLHKYDIENKVDIPLNKIHTLLEERVISLCITSDRIIWVATAGNGIIAVCHDSVIAHITTQQGLTTNCNRTIAVGKKGQILIGTNEGISFVDYSLSISNPSVKNISTNDGLTSNIINKILFLNDTIYAATNNGISVIPASISTRAFDIPIRIIGIKINQKDTFIQTQYELGVKQNNINLQFAGIELGGHFRNAQLSLDEGKTWEDIEGTNLSLQLGSGRHFIWLRAVDINRNTGNQILKLQFNIATPFFKAWWFWLLVSIMVLAASFYMYTRSTRRKHQQKINTLLHQKELNELEIQALKSQINPHFVFNCLNSIQGFIYEEDFENADIYLRKFSDILRSTLHYSSQPSISIKEELDYIETYLTLEKLRFGNKFSYSIDVQEGLLQDELFLPAMLLQPFIENAITHGLNHLKGRQGKLMIKVYLADSSLHILIDDNGIGREQANKIKQHRHGAHESKGTKLTQRRLELYHIKLNITDKQNENEQGCGTNIHLQIPVPLM